MATKIELKKELQKLGIQVVKGNYIKKSDALKIIKSKEKPVKANMADRFRAKTKTKKPSSDSAKLDYVKEKNKKSPVEVEGPVERADATESNTDLIL